MSEESSQQGRSWLRDAISPRTMLLVLGVLLLQLAFVYSYVGAFHDPRLHDVTIDVAGPRAVADDTVDSLNELDDSPLDARTVTDERAARDNVADGTSRAALVIDPRGDTDTLYVASAGGSSLADAVGRLMTQVEQRQGRQLDVTDVVPPQSGDNRGLTTFYLVVGWLVGGYLAAAALGSAKGSRPATFRRALVRLVSMVPYAIVSGLGGALIVDTMLEALTGHFVMLWAVGAGLVFAAAAVTMALQVLFGMVGIGVTLLLFVIIGNPSAGGAYPMELLPSFWRVIGPWLPGGAGVTAIRQYLYFDGNDVFRPILVIAAWCLAGVVVMMVAAALRHRRDREPVAAR